jgi:hypothetical protein
MPALRSVAAEVLPFPANLCWRARSPRAFLVADGERRDAEDGKREADMQAAGEAGPGMLPWRSLGLTDRREAPGMGPQPPSDASRRITSL